LEASPLSIRGTEVIVERASEIPKDEVDSDLPVIIVSNLPDDADEDYLEMFFENKRKFGDVGVASVQLEGKSAIITFTDPNGTY